MAEVTLFQAQEISTYILADIYNPTTGTGHVIPVVGSLVNDVANGGVLYWVQSVDPVTHASTLAQETILVVDNGDDSTLTSVVSYGNDIFRVYFDIRTKPWAIQPDTHAVVYGINNSNYKVIRYPGTPQEVSIALYYDASGNFNGDRVPLVAVDQVHPGAGTYFTPCNTSVQLVEGERLRLDVYNSYGALTCQIYTFAKQATIQNENVGRIPVIIGMAIGSSQLRSNNEIYIYERQDPGSLAITATLQYDDGTNIQVEIDGQRCFLYGLEDFIASYPGLQQQLVVKYFLTTDQNVNQTLLDASGSHITSTINLVVIPNQLASSVKLAVIPRWSALLNQYSLFYYLYKVDGTSVVNVTQWISISEGSYNGSLFGVAQDFTVLVDLQQMDPVAYLAPTPYQQEVIITLQPSTVYQRYTIRDASDSQYVYGVDSAAARRPVLYYDTTRQQYFIPTTLFPTTASFLQAFYMQSSPPYDAATTTVPPVPTHFFIRDAATGLPLITNMIPIAEYELAMSFIGSGDPSRFVTSNVLIEFIVQINNATNNLIFGSSVDCYSGLTPYLGP